MPALSLMKLDYYTIKKIRDLRNKGHLVINSKYQRSYVWTKYQKKELIDSILDNFPIGVLVLWKHKQNEIEILDGQQRVKTIESYLSGDKNIPGRPFNKLGTNRQAEFYGYKIPYLRLDQSLTREDVSDIFVRLQEGIRLSLGEKLYAFRGNFRDAFVNAYFSDYDKSFFERINDWRFKSRALAAMLLALELETDFEKGIFPELRYLNFKKINFEYKKKKIPSAVLKRYNANLQFLGKYMYGMLGRLKPQDIVGPYLLVSYFKRHKVNEKYQGIIFKNFMMEFQGDLQKFSLVKPKKPKDLTKTVYDRLTLYKIFTRRGIVPESFEERFNIMKKEYERRIGKIKLKDSNRFFTQEQKLELYFNQKGICPSCKKDILYDDVEADHIMKHEHGGKTEVENGQLLHHKCHLKKEKQKK